MHRAEPSGSVLIAVAWSVVNVMPVIFVPCSPPSHYAMGKETETHKGFGFLLIIGH